MLYITGFVIILKQMDPRSDGYGHNYDHVRLHWGGSNLFKLMYHLSAYQLIPRSNQKRNL